MCELVAATCAGGHEHGSTVGVRQDKKFEDATGTNLTVNGEEWAVGYTEPLVEKLLAGAQKFLESRRRAAVHFPVDDGDNGVAEESVMDADQAVQDNLSSHELPENVRGDLVRQDPKGDASSSADSPLWFGASF